MLLSYLFAMPLSYIFHELSYPCSARHSSLLRARLLSGAAELTTHLLRLISILWFPLCRINQLGFISLEDCGDPLYLWVINEPCIFSTIIIAEPINTGYRFPLSHD